MAHLVRIDWPHTGIPDLPPALSLPECRARLAALRRVAKARGLEAVVVYGDREHFANLHWLTGFDPRFEEAVLVVTAKSALLLAGNECLPYTAISPLVQAGDVQTELCASLSLQSQPRQSRALKELLAEALPQRAHIGTVGWKYYGPTEVDDPATALEIPAFLADPLRALCDRVENATDLMMHPSHGIRARVDAAEIARLEFSNQMAAAAMRRMAFALHDGMTDFAAYQAGQVGGVAAGLPFHLCDRGPRRAGVVRADGAGDPARVAAVVQRLSLGVQHLPVGLGRAGGGGFAGRGAGLSGRLCRPLSGRDVALVRADAAGGFGRGGLGGDARRAAG
jgi:hypothetical protein